MRHAYAVAALCTALAAPALAQTGTGAWVHVRVQETGRDSKVSVNLPVSVVHAALQAAPDRVVSRGKVQLGDRSDMKVSDLRRAWQELAKAGDAEIVSVDQPGEKVSVRRSGDKLLVLVDKAGDKEHVRVEVPARVVDAFFDAPGEEVNLRAAIAELERARGELVKVDDRDSSVRIWIDEKP